MEPKEKALEIIARHTEILSKIVDDLPNGYIERNALSEVNGVLWALNDIDGDINMSDYIDWWEEVKEEITLK